MVLKPNGKTWRCVPCHQAYMAKWHEENPRQKTARRPGKCSRCGADKPKGTDCKPCENAWQRERYQRLNGHRKQAKGICRKCGGPSSRKTPCKPCRTEYVKAWGQSNYLSNPEAVKARNKRWKDANPDALKAHKARRRARELEAEGHWNASDIAAIRKKQKGRCNGCQCKLTRQNECIDHIVPLARGGSNWPWNLQLLCKTCNGRKWAHLPEIAVPSLFEQSLVEGSNAYYAEQLRRL